ncbi:hypothetical protein, partial [Ruegeria sp.]|uniref:hypothetical protein n=1 Tax=Ruegeria sp. TaxID=1879320 RepID=UPI003B003F18
HWQPESSFSWGENIKSETPYFNILYRPHFSLLRPHFSLLRPHFSLLRPHFSLLRPHFSLLAVQAIGIMRKFGPRTIELIEQESRGATFACG